MNMCPNVKFSHIDMRVWVIPLFLMAITVLPPRAEGQISQGQAIALALEAARADAYRNLLESIHGLRVRGGTTVRNMAVESSEIQTRLEDFIRGAEVIEEEIEPDGVARVVIELDLDRLERLLGASVEDGVRKFRIEGFGAPPSQNQPQGGAQSEIGTVVVGSPEAWNRDRDGALSFGNVVTVVGTAARDDARARSAGQARLLAERAATADAYRKILELVYGISISSATTVRDMVLADDRLDTQVSGFIRGARIEGTRHTVDGIAEVTMSLDLSGLKRYFP